MPKKKTLNEQEVMELRHAYRLYRENMPKNLAPRFGIAIRTLYDYIHGTHDEYKKNGPPTWK